MTARDHLIDWLRRQYAVDETRLREAMFTHRVGHADPVDASDLERITDERARLDTMTDDELRQAAARYADRSGFLEEWRA